MEDATDANGESINCYIQVLVEDATDANGESINCYIQVLVEDATDANGESITVIFRSWWRMQQMQVENL